MGAIYIFGNKNSANVTHILSNAAAGIISNPYKLENTLCMLRTLAPLASVQTVGKINTFLPLVEKFSSIIGMYSFLNKAQNYAPIQSLGDKSAMEKVTALISNGNIPISKILAQPIIAKNIEKLMGAAAGSFINSSMKNMDLDKMLSTFISQTNIKSSDSSEQNKDDSSNSGMDLNSILEMLAPLLNNNNNNNNNNNAT